MSNVSDREIAEFVEEVDNMRDRFSDNDEIHGVLQNTIDVMEEFVEERKEASK